MTLIIIISARNAKSIVSYFELNETQIVVDQYIAKADISPMPISAGIFKSQHQSMCSRQDFYFDGDENGSA